MSARQVVAKFLLLCIISSTVASKNYSMHLNQGLEGKTLYDPYEDSPVLVFGYCHNNHCTFFREREYSSYNFDSASHLRSCSFNFDKGEVLELRSFGQHKIIFTYEVKENKRFGILNLLGCRTYTAEIADDVKMSNARVIFTNETNFVIGVNNRAHDAICREKTCKMIFDDEGRALSGLNEWITEDNYRSVSFYKQAGYIVVDGNIPTRSLRVYQVNETGEEKILTNMVSFLIPPVSTTHGFLTTCETTDFYVRCVQFNETGIQTSEMWTEYQYIKQIKLHNLAGGGYLLLTSKCPKYSDTCYENITNFFVTKVDAKGKIVGHFTMTQFSADLYFELNNVHVFLKDGNELCFSHVAKRFLRNMDEQIVEIFCNKKDIVSFVL